MNQALYKCPTAPNHEMHPFFGFCLQLFCQAGPPQRVKCLVSIENTRKVSFPKTKSHCQFGNRTESQQPAQSRITLFRAFSSQHRQSSVYIRPRVFPGHLSALRSPNGKVEANRNGKVEAVLTAQESTTLDVNLIKAVTF